MIMDGNGRWAEARGLPRALGHRAGVDAVRRTIRATVALGIPYLTLYSFSTENWARPAREVEDLMVLMKRFLLRDLAELHQNGIRVRMIGCRHGVDPELLSLIDRAVSLTEANTTLTLNIAFNYGARDEITNAVREIAERVASGEIAASEIDHGTVAQALDTADIPDPDLLIRTSGELRLSNFLLWQLAYAEFVFLDDYWPDFGHDLLVKALNIFQSRDRRFGALASKTHA